MNRNDNRLLTVEIKTKKDLKIYMNPSRQKLLRLLTMSEKPLTAKELSLRMEVSASSVQHHIKLLEQIGLVIVDHTAQINGITATYYASSDAITRIGMEKSDMSSEREALALQVLQDVWNGFTTAMRERRRLISQEDVVNKNTMYSGIAHMTADECKELQRLMMDFIATHGQARKDTTPWEYLVLAYDTKMQEDGK